MLYWDRRKVNREGSNERHSLQFEILFVPLLASFVSDQPVQDR